VSVRLTFTVEEAAELLGVGRGTAYEAARRGELPTVRLGRRLLVPRHALEQLLDVPTKNGDGREVKPNPSP
jgi:excisionase family DNA binding protein